MGLGAPGGAVSDGLSDEDVSRFHPFLCSVPVKGHHFSADSSILAASFARFVLSSPKRPIESWSLSLSKCPSFVICSAFHYDFRRPFARLRGQLRLKALDLDTVLVIPPRASVAFVGATLVVALRSCADIVDLRRLTVS